MVIGTSGEQIRACRRRRSGADVVLVSLEGQKLAAGGDVPVLEEGVIARRENVELVMEAGEADNAGRTGVGIEATEREARGGVEDENRAGVRTRSKEAAVATEGRGVSDVGER